MFTEVPATKYRLSRRKLLYGVGINDALYQVTQKTENSKTVLCPYYAKWISMIRRVYSEEFKLNQPAYADCTIHPDWLRFSNFRSWMEIREWQGLELDKDLKNPGNKEYSKDNCLFVSEQVNTFFTSGRNKTSGLPPGVQLRNNKYEVTVSVGKSKKIWVGTYRSIGEALEKYLEAKEKSMYFMLNTEQNQEVKEAVVRYFRYFSEVLYKTHTDILTP